MHSLRTDERQCLAELVGVHPSHHLGETLQEDGVDVGRGVQLVCLAFLRQTEALEEHVVRRGLDVVRLVVLHQFLFFLAGEPITLSLGKLRFQLGEELLVLQGRVLYLLFHLDAEVASASRRVVQQVATVGGADERGHTGQMAVLGTMCLAIMQGGHLHQVLQKWKLARREFVVLIQLKKLV